MTKHLASDADATPPLGELRIVEDAHLILATIELDGHVIASGRAGLAGDWCVPDRIRTVGSHRRRGLGSAIMIALLQSARGHGARRAVLDASRDGRALYLATGWQPMAWQFGLTRLAADERTATAPPTRTR